MQQLQLGNFQAAAQLFERWKLVLFNFFLRQTGDRELAEDMTQSVFERMIKYRSTYKIELAFRAWIFQIARNLLFSNQKKRQSRAKALAGLINPGPQESDRIDLELERKESKAKLWRAMDGLAPDEREVLLLAKIQKIPYREIGEILNCREGTVKVKVHRAMSKLKSIFVTLEE
ncbi:MAG: RNA polymerase sigma factor [Saprospiraceae bacterium]|nr:RNA polymerase sigma factor [Saprospiraceae bacterium]